MTSTSDFSQVVTLASAFTEMGRRLPREVRDSVKKAGQNVKNDTQRAVSNHIRWKHVASSVNYDFGGTGSSSFVEIGYDKRGQGNFGHILEYGSSKKAPHPALIPAFESEAQRFPEFMAQIAAEVSRKAL